MRRVFRVSLVFRGVLWWLRGVFVSARVFIPAAISNKIIMLRLRCSPFYCANCYPNAIRKIIFVRREYILLQYYSAASFRTVFLACRARNSLRSSESREEKERKWGKKKLRLPPSFYLSPVSPRRVYNISRPKNPSISFFFFFSRIIRIGRVIHLGRSTVRRQTYRKEKIKIHNNITLYR